MSIPSQEQVTLLTDYDENSAYSRAYQMLYANISFNWNEAQQQQAAITFMTPSSYAGQATVAANIAIVAARNGTPTIIVDADLRTPTLQQRFGVNANAGLGDLLAHSTGASVSDVLCETFVPKLYLLSAGTGSPQGLQVHDLPILHRIVDELRHSLASNGSGLIVFNSPAVLANPDATLISSIVDQVFLLIVAGNTTRQQAKQAQEQLQHAHATLTGVVMLDV
jgi:succinoglycan biosynthesis transport protein ExoP